MDVTLTWPDTPVAYSTAPAGENTVFHFHTPSDGQTTINLGYGPKGSVMMRNFHLQGPGVDWQTNAQQVQIVGHVGAPVIIAGVIVSKQGYQPNADYTVTVNNPKPTDSRTTEMYYMMKPSSGG